MKQIARLLPDPWSGLAFLLPFSLYLWCLAPSITFYDSGEFITAVDLLGSAHSPGYPLFLLYAKPFTWLPLGSIAFRVNLATAVSAALACLGCYHLVRALLEVIPLSEHAAFTRFTRSMAALSGALLLAVSPRLWLQSNHDKPYPLLAALTALMVVLLLRWKESYRAGSEQPAWWYAVAFLAGLATGIHQTIVLLLPGLLALVLVTAPGTVLRFREWLLSCAFLLMGGMVQLYLPLRAAAQTRQNWGDPSALSRFLWHLLRQGYPETPHPRDLPLLLKQLGAFSIPHEFGWVGLLLVAAGCWACWKMQRAFLAFCLISLVCFWLVIVGHFNPQTESIFLTEEFYTPLYLLAAALISSGLYALAARGVAAAQSPQQYGLQHFVLISVLFLLMPLFQFAANLQDQDQHRNYLAQDYAVNTLRSLPEEAVLFTWGDSGAFPLWYLQGVERLREDVDLPHIPHLVFAWHRQELPRLAPAFAAVPSAAVAEQQFAELVRQLSPVRPVLIDFSTRYSINWQGRLPLQYGMLYWPGDSPMTASDGDEWQLYALHRLQPDGWLLDADSEKALIIHAYSLMQTAEDLARRGHGVTADRLLTQVGRLMPQWQESLDQLRSRYALPQQKGMEP
jgi:4-amino-4-deoxy-L-arabinose transferase-like glycosyltransferase